MNDKLSEFIEALGSLAETSHLFYSSMLTAGASQREAEIAMSAFIRATIVDAVNGNSKDKG